MKKIALLLVFVLMMTFVGCGGDKVTPQQATESLCELYVHLDTTNSARLKLDKAASDELIGVMKDSMKETFISNATSGTTLEITDEQASAVVDAMIEARKKLSFTVEMVSEEKDTAKAKITISPLPISEIDMDAAQKAQDALLSKEDLDPTDMDALQKELVKFYTEALVENLKAAQPMDKKSELTVTLKKTDGVWLPENIEKFAKELAGTIEE